jgi:hypothetical protein
MADLVSYYSNDEKAMPSLMATSDCRDWSSDCTCSVCKQRKTDAPKKLKSLFEDYNIITLTHTKALTPHQYLLCPIEMPAFVFRTRTWGKKAVDGEDRTIKADNKARDSRYCSIP